MRNKWKIYLPLIIFLLFTAAASAWAMSVIIPSGNHGLPNETDGGRNTVLRCIGEPSAVNELPLAHFPERSREIDQEEINRMLIAEGLPPIEILPEPAPEPPAPVQAPPHTPDEGIIEIPPIQEIIPEMETHQEESSPKPLEQIPPPIPESLKPVETVDTSAPRIEPPVVFLAASYDVNPKPPYPKAAERKHMEGTVILKIKTGADGIPIHVEILISSGYPILDSTAVDTVRDSWRFRPATINGVYVESWVEVPIIFTLD